MPAGPQPVYQDSPVGYGYHDGYHEDDGYRGDQGYREDGYQENAADLTTGEESAATILQSVKQQEAQFEQLTRELEQERQSVAHQLEKCKLGSETASMSSISSTDESFRWHPPPPEARFDEESVTESNVSGSNLVDSCLFSNTRVRVSFCRDIAKIVRKVT